MSIFLNSFKYLMFFQLFIISCSLADNKKENQKKTVPVSQDPNSNSQISDTIPVQTDIVDFESYINSLCDSLITSPNTELYLNRLEEVTTKTPDGLSEGLRSTLFELLKLKPKYLLNHLMSNSRSKFKECLATEFKFQVGYFEEGSKMSESEIAQYKAELLQQIKAKQSLEKSELLFLKKMLNEW